MIFEELWLVLDADPHGGAYNMAMDEVLLRQAPRPLLRVYGWSGPAVSFGYFGRFVEVRRLWPERELVRRWTGGGMVPHGEDLTYTLVAPKSESFTSRPAAESYRMIHEAVAEALGDSGGSLSLAAGAPKISDECFANPAPHDVLAGAIKVAGAAQRRTRHGLLHQGSIQRSGLGHKFARRLSEALSRRVAIRSLTPEERAQAARLAAEKYGAPEWLGRF
jgi:lipoate-protein ligase A